jgi:gluconolactonase
MKTKVQETGIVTAMLFVLVITASAQSGVSSVSFAQSVQKLADGFKFTEGPAADNAGNVFFTDIPNSRIHRWSTGGTLSTFIENSGQANGLYFDKNGHLVACAGGIGKLISIDPQGNITVLADRYKDKPFNSPNDLWIDPAGGIYFSDPRYGSRDNLPQDGECVYYLAADRKRLIRVIDDMVRPNGLIGTADGKLLYVADHGAGKTYVYKILPDGTLSDKKLFAEQGSDGLTLDEKGNVYLTEQAVTVYDPSGQLIQTIDVPETPSNVCFGGTNKRTLFITARTSLYSIERTDMQSKFYTFTMTDIDGKPVALSTFQGNVVLVVNVASQCGFTRQYADLQQLYQKYQDQGFVILGFPANNFLGQEPGTNAEIKTFCTSKFNVTFPMFAKISVKGKDIDPLYKYLTSPEENGEYGKTITWNFNKFLINKHGKTIGYFGSRVKPLDSEIVMAVEKALKE